MENKVAKTSNRCPHCSQEGGDGSLSWVKVKADWRRQWHPTPVLLTGKSHGQRSLVGCSPWGRKESDTTERLHFHFSLSCNGEGNGNPLQCSCLENPKDGGAWWAAVYGVAQSWTQLKWLSSSSSALGDININFEERVLAVNYIWKTFLTLLYFWIRKVPCIKLKALGNSTISLLSL